MENIYSASPQDVPENLTQASSAYKRRAWLAMAGLTLFLSLYLGLAGWFTWTAARTFYEVFAVGRWVYIFAALCASFLAVFMWKALFFVQHGSAPDALEVNAIEQPRLFEYLYRLADEAGSPRPVRVFLSARVNAAVFYDLSILNLFFPTHKNLEIGLALVNVLSLSEIKAVLAHEFGHFAQRTMAIGSWVYVAHQIAVQVTAKRDALDRMLQTLSHTDPRIGWVGWALSLVVWSIRSLMDTVLRLVLLAQRALSRQMEFQADLVAVSLTGSNELVHALHKLHAADDAWNRTLNFTDTELRENRIPHDLFAVHTKILEKISHILSEENYGKTPPVASSHPELHRVFKNNFSQPPQMWATHPTNADREENAKRHYFPATSDERSAWLLFDHVDQLKQKVRGHLIGQTEAQAVAADETFKSLDESYAALKYDPHYRGVYFGRSIVRHVSEVSQLYQGTLRYPNILQALDTLYAPKLTEDLDALRELVEERQSLEALRDRVYQPVAGRIMYRGTEISRRQLPASIREVQAEEDEIRLRVLAHDRQCRATHLAVAETLGGGWRDFMLGLLHVLHYAEHTLANLRDAQGLLGKVWAVVRADGIISKRERKQLIKACNELQSVLLNIHEQKTNLKLDAFISQKMAVVSWQDMLGEFKLPIANDENLGGWMKVIDSWVDHAAKPLTRLGDTALELLLMSEVKIATHLREATSIENAPTPSSTPENYPILLPGQERKRQIRLGLWDRFQTADGVIPGILKFLVAGAMVTAVLSLGSGIASYAQLSIYNGLDREVQVTLGKQQFTLQARTATNNVEFEIGKFFTIETHTKQGERVEHFTPSLTGHVEHYVYNVAGASPLVERTISYGNGSKRPPRMLGAPRWSTIAVDYYFTAAPESVKTKNGEAYRQVLEGMKDSGAIDVLAMLTNDEARNQVILAHAKWDNPNQPQYAVWRELAVQMEALEKQNALTLQSN